MTEPITAKVSIEISLEDFLTLQSIAKRFNTREHRRKRNIKGMLINEKRKGSTSLHDDLRRVLRLTGLLNQCPEQ
jgi:hypothetical protein